MTDRDKQDCRNAELRTNYANTQSVIENEISRMQHEIEKLQQMSQMLKDQNCNMYISKPTMKAIITDCRTYLKYPTRWDDEAWKEEPKVEEGQGK